MLPLLLLLVGRRPFCIDDGRASDPRRPVDDDDDDDDDTPLPLDPLVLGLRSPLSSIINDDAIVIDVRSSYEPPVGGRRLLAPDVDVVDDDCLASVTRVGTETDDDDDTEPMLDEDKADDDD